MLWTRRWPWNKADEHISLCWDASPELSPLRLLYQKDLLWGPGPACWTDVWIHCQSLHQTWAQAPARGTRDTTRDKTHKSLPLAILHWRFVRDNEPNKWYRVLEGDGGKKKLRARKDRPEGQGEYAVLNRIREDYRQRLQREPALFLSQARKRSAKALWPAEQRGGTEEEMRADCECLVRTSAFTVISGWGMLGKNSAQENSG